MRLLLSFSFLGPDGKSEGCDLSQKIRVGASRYGRFTVLLSILFDREIPFILYHLPA